MARVRKTPTVDECTQEGYPGALLRCPDFMLATLGYLISYLMDETLAPLGLRVRHYHLLRILSIEGAQRQTTIGTQLGVDRTSVVALIDDLERLGLAKRKRSPGDRRVYIVDLTPKGRKVAAQAIDRVSEAERAMFQPLESKEKSELQRLLISLLAGSGPIAEQHRHEMESLVARAR
jgi:DNA-binding MarR family transcriptional regulator